MQKYHPHTGEKVSADFEGPEVKYKWDRGAVILVLFLILTVIIGLLQ